MSFCNDVDLLYWEPELLHDAEWASQTLIKGTGNLDGSTFTVASGSLADANVQAGQVIVLSGALSGCFPIISVNSATELTISVLYEGTEPSPVGSASGVNFAIRTFWAQRRMVSDLIQRAAGIEPGVEASSAIVNAPSLRRACALGTLQMIYSALAATAEHPARLLARAEMYERLYRRALRSARVELDLDGDGKADTTRLLNVVRFERV